MDLIITKSEMDLIRDHVLDMLDPELAAVVEGAEPLGLKWHIRFADDSAEAFLDSVAGEANHAQNARVQNALDRLADHVEKEIAVSARPVTLPKMAPHPNEMDRLRIETSFASPAPDKIRCVVEVRRSGYVLLETRPPRRGGGDWTRSLVAKILWSRMRQNFGVYRRRRNKWELVGDVKRLDEAIGMIRRNEGGLFFG